MRRMPARPGLRLALNAIGRRMPRTRGELRVAGLAAEVTIGRDRWGIPHIEAASAADAWFGLGFCHGQDRGFQLELLARAGRGTLSELLGRETLALDRLSRTLGFARLADAQLGHLDADVVATLDAYVAGINAGAYATPRPHELVLLRRRRTPWRTTDVLAFLGLQSLALSGNWDTEVARLQILRRDGADALAAVDRTYAGWLPVVDPPGAMAGPALDRLLADIAALRDVVGGAGASNAWAVAGTKTASGAPILANDPHLGPNVPAPWYLAHLRTPDWEVAGASFVGGPAFPSGHNGFAAWGITAGCTDSADLFWEELDPARTSVRGPAGDEAVERLQEEIGVRGGEPHVEEVIVTPRGPIVTSILDDAGGAALSLRATWLEPAPVRGLLDVVHCRDFATFRNAFRAWPGPALNIVYADAAGHIGWQLIGTLPRRTAGNGTLPRPAWEAGWEAEHLAFDAMPWMLDPPSGYVASANNAPRADAADAPYLGVDWLDGYRAAAITAQLAARDDWDVRGTAILQLDVTSVAWLEMRAIVTAVEPTSSHERLGMALLRAWDGTVGADSAAAAVFELFVAELAIGLAREAAPRSWQLALGGGIGEAYGRTSFGARTVGDVVAALRKGTGHQAAIRAALHAAVSTLAREHGPDVRAWAWGRVRPLRLRHALGGVRPLGRVLNLGPVAIGGDSNTVAQAGIHPLRPTDNPGAIANHRMVVDLADPERSRFVVAGGQSGNPASPHYGDLFELWRRGEGVPIAWSRHAVEAAIVERLVLAPGMAVGAPPVAHVGGLSAVISLTI